MSAALQIYYSGFDAAFFKLPPKVRSRIEAKIDEIGLRLKNLPHHRLTGHDRYQAERNVIHLPGVGHPREIHRGY